MTKEDIREEYDKKCKYNMYKIDGGFPYRNDEYLDYLENKIIELDKQIIREI